MPATYISTTSVPKAQMLKILRLKRSLTIGKITYNGGSKVVCNADGSATIKISVELTNSGNVDLNPGDENFSLSLINWDGKPVYATSDITQAIAQGKAITYEATFNIANAKSYTGYKSMYVQENISNTKKWAASFSFVPYEPGLMVSTEEETL